MALADPIKLQFVQEITQAKYTNVHNEIDRPFT